MNICYISTTFFSDTDLGVLKSICSGNKICYAVVVPAKQNNYSIEELRDVEKAYGDFITIKVVQQIGRIRNPRNFISYYKWLLEVKLFNYDVIYVNNTEDVYLSVLLKLFLRNRRFIYGVHDAANHSGWRTNKLKRIANGLLMNKASCLLTFSKSQAEVLKRRFATKLMYTIPLGLKDYGASKVTRLACRPVTFLFFGNISSYKGLDILTNAVKVLASERRDFRLVIAGRCDEWAAVYEPLVAGIPQIEKCVRFISNQEIPDFFSSADYLVLPYRDVTQSGPLMIAYNYGVPVLASRLGGFQEFLVEGISGYFFNPNDVQDLVKILREAIMRSHAEYDALKSSTLLYAAENYGSITIAEMYTNMFQSFIYSNNTDRILNHDLAIDFGK